MLQESVAWDPQNMVVEPSIESKIYVLFLVAVCGVTIVKLIQIWRAALSSRFSSQTNNLGYLKLLRSSHRSLAHWIWCTLLGWAILSSITLYDFCNGMLNEKVTGRIVVLLWIRELSTSLSMALCVVLFVFLIRWHIAARIERLSTHPGAILPN